MLEQEITLLREEVCALREVMQAFAQTLNQPKAEAPKAEAPKAEATKKVEAPKADVPTREDLQELCMAIVRADRAKKVAIKETIGKYGAENLVGVKDGDLPYLFEDLKAL